MTIAIHRGMKTHTIELMTRDDDKPVTVEVTYSRATKDRFDTRFGNWVPGDPDEVDIVEARFDGEEVELTDAEIEAVEEMVRDRYA